MAPSVTLHDVAARAGVHYSTASRVLNGQGKVSSATRERILKAAADLDFVPNAQALFFARGTSRTFGVLTQDAAETFALPTFGGASLALGAHDIAMLHYDASGDAAALERVTARMRSRQIEALLVLGKGPEQPLEVPTSGLRVPVAFAYAISANRKDTSFVTDGVGAGRMVADHLLDLGRSRFAHVTTTGSMAAQQRYKGFVERLRERDTQMAVRRALRGDWSRGWGEEAARRLLPRIGELDAIFCGNDAITLGVESVLTRHGVRVPDDIALVGYDNAEGHGWPGEKYPRRQHLTTVDPRLSEIGRCSIEALVSAAAGTAPLPRGPQPVPGKLILGETTAASA
ncbi:LacI family DNA-binding transcriptional regulator [Streptomyces rugosispiralis]|uniref:LacI family transcriptional regulator n=1 Tax=Streptomyces rugosispiralis TaxID=2967341 RepID=A0ABT1V5F5_9ACTN|nr:LacI family DNA-binding transcriptional regulator [Streptomyces rugosispiralis]MCQ8192617.1 LacI family transcriptional regulator [Streptomyces rugosispiralis]